MKRPRVGETGPVGAGQGILWDEVKVQRSRPLLCGEAVEAGRDDRDGQASTRAVTEECFQLTGLANGRGEDGERTGGSRRRLKLA